MNQIAVLAAVETVSYPLRTTRTISRGKHISLGKNHEAERTEMGKSPFADSGGRAHALTRMHAPTHPVASAIYDGFDRF